MAQEEQKIEAAKEVSSENQSPQSAQEEQNEILETASYARELGQQPQRQMSEPVSSENQSPKLAQEEPKVEAPKEISSDNK